MLLHRGHEMNADQQLVKVRRAVTKCNSMCTLTGAEPFDSRSAAQSPTCESPRIGHLMPHCVLQQKF